MKLHEAISDYSTLARAEGKATTTLSNIKSALEVKLLGYCRDQDISHTNELHTDLMTGWVAEMLNKGDASSSVRTYVRTTRTFLNWLIGRSECREDIKVPAPKENKNLLPEVLNDDEIARLEKRLKTMSTANAVRDKAMVYFFLASGVRLNEIIHLNVDDLRSDGTAKVVHGKGGKTRIVYCSPHGEAGKALKVHAKKLKPGQLVFGKADGTPLTPMAVQKLVNEIGKKAGVELNPHKFRRTWCSTSIAMGMPAQVVQKLAGWSDMSVIERYLHLATNQEIAIAARFARF